MYKLSVPISMETLTEESLPLYEKYLTACGVDRVFLVCVGEMYRKDGLLFTQPQWLQRVFAWLRSLGIEVGVWVNGLGHGELLVHQSENERGDYTPMEGVDGSTAPVAYCPLDSRFVEDYCAGIRRLAELGPDLIMLDDDLRFNPRVRFFRLACFCPKHLSWFYELVGETVPREQIEEKIFTGGPNKYRDAFLHMMGKTLLDFAKQLRRTVDEVNPAIRMGACVTTAMWDFSGTDVVELAKAFAGATRPFARISGAPYRDYNIIPIIEASRQQCAWGEGVELFCEGDTYPRPRTNVPSRPLELFDLAMLADGTADGMLQYVFDYNHSLVYEQGYARRLQRNMPLRRQTAELFEGKSGVGVQVYDVMHKFRHWQLPDRLDKQTVTWIQAKPSKGASADILARNSIPTAFTETGYPVLLLGENARHIDLRQLKNGAIVDVTAAEILQSRGVDVGLLSAREGKFFGEQFLAEGETVRNIGVTGQAAVTCRDAALIESRFVPGGSPASYRYENAAGQRFFLLAFRFHTPGAAHSASYLRSWCRRRQLVSAVQWLCGKPLPAVLEDAPEACVLTSSDGRAMAVAVLNLYQDEIIEPVIRLDGVYKTARFVGCTGALEGDRVKLSSVSPYGFAAFEVTP